MDEPRPARHLTRNSMRALAVSLLTLLAPYAYADDVDPTPDLRRAAGLGIEAEVRYGASLDASLAVGVVLRPDRGRLLVLRREESSGHYMEEAESAEFPNMFGPRENVEIVEVTSPERFMVQVNSRTTCGIQLEHYRIARVHGRWKVAGYDRYEPDSQDCDVNQISRAYSANLLTGQVRITEFVHGVPTRKYGRGTKRVAPDLRNFQFDMFMIEP